MKLPQHIFALTKAEQRVLILLVTVLLALAGAKYYRELSFHCTALSPPADSSPVSAPAGPEE